MALKSIKQIPDDYADSTGLAKYNRSRMPGCKDSFAAAINPNGKYNTGLDEKAQGLSKDEAEKILQLRTNYEKILEKDLGATSPFWESFAVTIYSDSPKIFNTDNPLEDMAFRLLVANRNVAPSKEDIMNPDFRDAQYYAFTEDSENAEEISSRKKRDNAIVALMGIAENKEKMLLYGQYLEGLKYYERLSEETIYKMLRAYVDDKNLKNATNFLEAMKKSPEELQQKIIVDKALKQRLISRVRQGKHFVYQFGQVTLGSTPEELYKNLSMPDFAPELLALKSQLDK